MLAKEEEGNGGGSKDERARSFTRDNLPRMQMQFRARSPPLRLAIFRA